MKNKATEQKIMDAALDVVAEKSISGTRVHLIAERAGIVQSNLHYYFKTKEDLMMAVLEKMLQGFYDNRKNLMAKTQPNLREKLNSFFTQKKRIIRTESRSEFIEMDFWSQSRVDDCVKQIFGRSHALWRNHVVQTMDEYVPDLPEEKKKLLAATTVSMMMGAAVQTLVNGDAFDLDDYFDLCLKMLLKEAQDTAGNDAAAQQGAGEDGE